MTSQLVPVLEALLHIASSSEVSALEITKKIHLEGQADATSDTGARTDLNKFLSLTSTKFRALESSTGDVGVSNYIAVTALQSGDATKPSPYWDAGIDGSNQYVQVTDTGFDDASCFLRDTDESASVLTGSFNSDVQLAWSTYDAPFTDKSRRKLVQYIKQSTTDETFGYNYADGHGTHVAGTFAGLLVNSAETVAAKDFWSDARITTQHTAT